MPAEGDATITGPGLTGPGLTRARDGPRAGASRRASAPATEAAAARRRLIVPVKWPSRPWTVSADELPRR